MTKPFQPVDQRGGRGGVKSDLCAEPARGGGYAGSIGVKQMDEGADIRRVQAMSAGEVGGAWPADSARRTACAPWR
jgi:hypothetical protein